jgi:hypothetical protein
MPWGFGRELDIKTGRAAAEKSVWALPRRPVAKLGQERNLVHRVPFPGAREGSFQCRRSGIGVTLPTVLRWRRHQPGVRFSITALCHGSGFWTDLANQAERNARNDVVYEPPLKQ